MVLSLFLLFLFSVFYFGFRLSDAGLFPRGAEIRLYKITGVFFQIFALLGTFLHCKDLVFSSVILIWVSYENKKLKNSSRGRDKFSTVSQITKCFNYSRTTNRLQMSLRIRTWSTRRKPTTYYAPPTMLRVNSTTFVSRFNSWYAEICFTPKGSSPTTSVLPTKNTCISFVLSP